MFNKILLIVTTYKIILLFHWLFINTVTETILANFTSL